LSKLNSFFWNKYENLYELKTLKQLKIKDRLIDCVLCNEDHLVSQIPFLHPIKVNGIVGIKPEINTEIEIFNNRGSVGKWVRVN